MPELPEVETTVRGLAAVLDGRRLVRVEPRRADLRRAIPEDLGQRLTGARVVALGRRGKYGLIGTDRGDTLVFHLGMSGSWRIAPAQLGRHDHLLLATDEEVLLALNDPRRFGSLDLVPTARIDEFPPFRALGPEPLGGAPDGDWLRRAFAGRTAPIKPLLLDQRIVAGVGNIYACEALHRARISPLRAAGTLSRERCQRLAAAIPVVLEESIAAGGSSLKDFAHPSGELGYFAASFRVYDREGGSCGCGGKVRRVVQGGRSTFYCPRCQR